MARTLVLVSLITVTQLLGGKAAGEPPAGKMAECTLWRYETEKGAKGYFLLKGVSALKRLDGEWIEMSEDKLIAQFKETKRCAEYVELLDASRNLSLRLYPAKVTWRVDARGWKNLPVKGHAAEESSIGKKPLDTCTTWRDFRGSAYLIKSGPEWLDMRDDGALFGRYKEVKRTAEYVELFDEKSKAVIRVLATQVLVKGPRDAAWRVSSGGSARQELKVRSGDFLAELGEPVPQATAAPTVPAAIDP